MTTAQIALLFVANVVLIVVLDLALLVMPTTGATVVLAMLEGVFVALSAAKLIGWVK